MPDVNPTPDEVVEKFQCLQAQLRDRVQSTEGLSLEEHDVLVIPSITLDQYQLRKVQGVHQYEERLLFSLTRLRNPRMRLVYVTSQPLHPSVIDYYLHLMPGIPFSHARERLFLFSAYDSSYKSLTEKVLERPRLVERIARALRPDRSYMVCFNATPFERELSVKLGLPLLASDPELLYWGTKSGSREIFAECQIPHPDGSPLVWTTTDFVEVATDLWERQPELQRIMVKLNEGFSGEGNAVLKLPEVMPQTRAARIKEMQTSLLQSRCQASNETWENFSARIPELGVIAEAFVEGEIKRSPSVQCLIPPSKEVEVLSTHEQVLGGPDGQIFQGCHFPADMDYRLQLQELGIRVGENLARKGALERFGLDFIVVRQGATWEIYGIEINLRRGGTTHPFMTLKLLTNGYYDQQVGLFYSRQDRPKFYVASDNLHNPCYQGLLPEDLMDIVAEHQLHFDNSTETGTVFHLMGCLSQFGKLGLTCIGNSPQHAQDLYQKVAQVLELETLGQGHYSV